MTSEGGGASGPGPRWDGEDQGIKTCTPEAQGEAAGGLSKDGLHTLGFNPGQKPPDTPTVLWSVNLR